MKQNKKYIPYYTFSYSKQYYITHPWKWFKDIWITIKNAWHRVLYSWDWVSLWNMDVFLGELIPNMIEELADRSCGAPYGDFEGSRWIEFEDWQNELRVLVTLMRIAHKGSDIVDNEGFEKDFAEWRNGTLLSPIKDMKFYSEYELPADAAAAIDTAKDKYERWSLMRKALLDIIFVHLRDIYDTLWD